MTGLDNAVLPSLFYFDIPQGSLHEQIILEDTFLDAETLEQFDFTADPEGDWTARMEVRTRDGALVCTYATSGEDGVIELTSVGTVVLRMLPEFTDALTPTTDLSTIQTGYPLVADVTLTDPLTGIASREYEGRGRISKKVTSG